MEQTNEVLSAWPELRNGRDGPRFKKSKTEVDELGQVDDLAESEEPDCRKSAIGREKILSTRLTPQAAANVPTCEDPLINIKVSDFAKLSAGSAEPRHAALRKNENNPGCEVSMTGRLKTKSMQAIPDADAVRPR